MQYGLLGHDIDAEPAPCVVIARSPIDVRLSEQQRLHLFEVDLANPHPFGRQLVLRQDRADIAVVRAHDDSVQLLGVRIQNEIDFRKRTGSYLDGKAVIAQKGGREHFRVRITCLNAVPALQVG